MTTVLLNSFCDRGHRYHARKIMAPNVLLGCLIILWCQNGQDSWECAAELLVWDGRLFHGFQRNFHGSGIINVLVKLLLMGAYGIFGAIALNILLLLRIHWGKRRIAICQGILTVHLMYCGALRILLTHHLLTLIFSCVVLSQEGQGLF